MPSPLFPNAQRLFKQQAKRAFEQSDFGQVVKLIDSARKGGASRARLRSLNRKLGQLRSSGILDILTKTDAGRLMVGVSRYARDSTSRDIMDVVFNALGPLGGILQSLLRPNGQSLTSSTQRELDAAQQLLEAFGYNVERPGGGGPKRGGTSAGRAESFGEAIGNQLLPPVEPFPESQIPPRPAFMQPRDNKIELHIRGQKIRVREDDPLLTGEMLDVTSSNVHSIGFIYNFDMPTKGTLKVRYLQKNQRGSGKSAGPLYAYHGVNPLVFQSFQRARSKGEFVWDRLRIRGTRAGHQFQYDLIGVAQGYVPRKATRFGPNEYFIRRQVQTRDGRSIESQLDDQFAGKARPQLPNRGLPNRGTPRGPNRGTPNRGR